MPPRTPTGIAINDAMPTMIPVPTIAWPIPAWDTMGHRGSHGGSSLLKRNCGWMTEGSPLAMVNHNTSPRGISARRVNTYMSPNPALLT